MEENIKQSCGHRANLCIYDDYCNLEEKDIDETLTRCVQIQEGLKVYMSDEQSCLDLEKKLNELGIKTRVGCVCDTDIWSVYIVSVPYELVGTYKIL